MGGNEVVVLLSGFEPTYASGNPAPEGGVWRAAGSTKGAEGAKRNTTSHPGVKPCMEIPLSFFLFF